MAPGSPSWGTVTTRRKSKARVLEPPPLDLGVAALNPVVQVPAGRPVVQIPAAARRGSDPGIMQSGYADPSGGADEMYYDLQACSSQRSHNRARKQTWSVKGQRNIDFQVEKRASMKLEAQARNALQG